MKQIDSRFVAIWLGCASLAVGSWAMLGLGIYTVLDASQRAALRALLDESAPMPILAVIGVAIITGFLAAWIRAVYFVPLQRAEQAVAIVANANPAYRVTVHGPPEVRSLLTAINGLGERLHAAASATEARIAEARSALELEKNRLAVLMAELPQSVIVCDAYGTIVLYNEQARSLFAWDPRLGGTPPGYIGLGRSVYGLLPRASIEGALKRLALRTDAGELDPIETLTAALPGERIARLRVSKMPGPHESNAASLGFVLLLEEITQDITGVECGRLVLTHLLTQTSAALAVLRPALNRLQTLDADAGAPVRAAADACRQLSAAVDAARAQNAAMDRDAAEEPAIVRAVDLADMIASALRHAGLAVNLDPPQDTITYAVPTHNLLQTVRYVSHRLRDEFDIRDVTLRLTQCDPQFGLELGWLGRRLSGATLAAWEDDPLSVGGEASAMTLREILQRQRASLTHEIDRATGRSRLCLNLSAPPIDNSPSACAIQARPIFYDFDLPALSRYETMAADTSLLALAYTAFDTETTGLDPAGGDQIISIGAIRIVNGRMLDGESFDQLIDTQRRIHPEAIKIHGIHRETLRGQPTLAQVLPRFHAYCADTVLLGHNVAFDLRFLQLQEDALGIRFRQPVLDTLLLAGVLHEQLEDNRLEAIAHRLGIEVVGRHTALGDARVTAAVFLKMLPLLAARGIRTLGEAQAASEKTRYARLEY